MSLPALTLRAVELEFYGIPETLSEAEQHRVKALTAINYLGNLGRIISLLSASKIAEPGQGFEHITPTTQIEEFDHGLWVLGDLQHALADSAYCSVEEMFIALTEQGSGVKSSPTSSGKPNG